MINNLIDNELKHFTESFVDLKTDHPLYYSELVDNYSKIANSLKTSSDFKYIDNEELLKFEIRRKFLENLNEPNKNFFTITSKDSFSNLPTNSVNLNWGKSIIYTPLNDHSRLFLHKGDVLFCYRQGQFDSLNDALDIRGIYGLGIAASEPTELFPDEEKHHKWGILVCFPLQLPKHLDLRNIQMHPQTIDLTPYNGNRNDALQFIPNQTHYKTLMDLNYSKNREIQKFFKVLFPDFNFNEIVFPNDALKEMYSKNSLSLANESKSLKKENLFSTGESVVINSFIEWFYREENYKKSYEGLITIPVLNFWNSTFFNNSLFKIDKDNTKKSLSNIENLITDKSKMEWRKYSEASGNGAPGAVLGKENYLKFLSEFTKDENNLQLLAISNLKPLINQVPFIYEKFCNDIKISDLKLSQIIVLRFTASLLTKPFVILTGLSGSGKTKLAQAFAMWICESEDQYCIVPVGADWTNREPLLGFPNALDKVSYVLPDNGALHLIFESIKPENHNKPYFLILDEMNLSHVERYFADFLSVMETKEEKGISLHSDTERRDTNNNKIEKNFKLTHNLFIIGTVNIDETTYMFSPKVLDRANVIEFRVTETDMRDYLQSSSKLDLDNLKTEGAGMAEAFVEIAKDQSLDPNDETKSELDSELINFFRELKKTGAEFGFRSAGEIYRFAAVLNKIEPEWTTEKIIDAAIMQKLLPKVHGSRKKLEPVLRKLGELCLIIPKDFEDILKSEDENIYTEKGKYPVSLEKICRMYKNLMHNGFTSYAEA